MKKLILVLVVLALAAPALAGDPTVKASQETVDVNIVVITYDVNETPDGNLFRAFALNVSVDSGATVGTPYDFNDHYYINPGSIIIIGGDVNNYGTPIAAQDSNSFTLEMGSLYASNDPCGHTTAPPKTGVVCRFTVDRSCIVDLEADSTRGGCVMEDTEGTFTVETIDANVTLGWPYPAIWDDDSFCYGDVDANSFINTDDWPAFRDGYYKNYWDHYPVDDQNPAQGEYNPAGDWDKNGRIDTDDWPPFRDNYYTTVLTDCVDGDPCEVYKLGSTKPAGW